MSLSANGVISELVAQGLAVCSQSECNFLHPLVEPLLEEFLPPPAGVAPASYYACMTCSQTSDLSTFDAGKFAGALDERVILPARHAVDIVTGHSYLTRLYTRMSPDEMTLDPVFAAHAGLPDVALPGQASDHIYCSQDAVMELPDGQRVALGQTSTWPRFDDMPFAARIEDFSSGSSTPALIADNGPPIHDTLSAHNKAYGLDDSGCACSFAKRGGFPAYIALLSLGVAGAAVRRRRRPDARA
jgi:MYXO-CTERM domain-containing protein